MAPDDVAEVTVRFTTTADTLFGTPRTPATRKVTDLPAATRPGQILVSRNRVGSMAMARPVITTPQALEGIDVDRDKEVFVVETPDQIADIAIKLAQDSDSASGIGELARKRVVDNYSWAAHLSGFKPYLTPTPAPAGNGEEKGKEL